MNEAIIVAIVVSIAPTIVALASLRQQRQTHILMNSRMSELLETTRSSSKAEGAVEERQASDERAVKLLEANEQTSAAKMQTEAAGTQIEAAKIQKDVAEQQKENKE